MFEELNLLSKQTTLLIHVLVNEYVQIHDIWADDFYRGAGV